MPAVFVDRDGTLNREVGYLPGDLRLADRERHLDVQQLDERQRHGRGRDQPIRDRARPTVTPAVLAAIHQTLRDRLARAGARLAGIYVCPHHPTAGARRSAAAIGAANRRPG
jgi:D-glycero-D-manno-heptose 1,7-bisphosphate phosphatase